ncbi:MAG TPA: LL-diaminopimelate aminotransferase [Saccharofermentans sp.]|nr:LL-diaminopimelate aminotransferase [Saccharofermentans sp.]HPE28076.1 LL-diaminopimelate aminotransferase [Saccharofermentans sp.]HPJ80946.1 LL-diaminopimelate aminotransferase [Saccharofermentans sp.]HPQ31417.1 LL-diaminopimelate aminotransferase [Saccharofermentans sp.]HRV50573.1 LL-diaminopimelate aminotransferase [Saccharofermentans sp.]
MHINSNYQKLVETYLFSDITCKLREFQMANPNTSIIKMGIGDVTRPLCKGAVEAIKKAADELGTEEGFRGYGPEQGYNFLKEAIASYYKKTSDVRLNENEIFISDGAKSDIGNILDIFSEDNTVVVTDPVYPVYVDTNIMAGRKVTYLPANKENGFAPMPEGVKGDIFYLCSPNNPTGACYTRKQLREWVDYANSLNAVILFDSAYEAFIKDPDVPKSIYEISGAKTCAIEFCSLSKTAGFTGTRCGYTIVPGELIRDGQSLQKMWLRRHTTKFNGVSYIVQRAAEACFTDEGLSQISKSIEYYRVNAAFMTKTFDELGWYYTGGKNSPYIWFECPEGLTSWEFFDELLTKANVVCTPGSGFGKCGEGYIRLTAFNTYENTLEAMTRIKKIFV